MNTFTTSATTKKGTFTVTISVEKKISSIQGLPFWAYTATINIDGKEIEAKIDHTQKDRIYATKAICDAFGVAFAQNIALKCDISEAVKYTNEEDRKLWDAKAAEAKVSSKINFIHNL